MGIRIKKIYLTFNVAEWPVQENRTTTEFSYRGIVKLLPLLEQENVKATFFITGTFARKESDIVRRIADEGHEIASYGIADMPHNNLNARKTYEGIRESKKILERFSKNKVIGFRMPHFAGNKYYLGIISKLGFRYDSSSNPAILPSYFNNFLKRKKPYMIESIGIKEVPITVSPLFQLPISTGFMRNFGNFYTLANIEVKGIINDKIILYFYPWEFINIQKMKGNPFMTRNSGARFRRQFIEFIRDLKKMHYKFDVLANLK